MKQGESKPQSALFKNIIDRASDISKKVAVEVHKSAKSISDHTKTAIHDQKVKKYNPLFAERFFSEDFKIPNIIQIVDDAVRRDIDVCEGAIGWISKVNDVEILYLYDEWIENSKIHFVPFPKCDSVYCVDNFDRCKFISSDSIFERSTNEKLAELEHIAYSLGAKSCTIEIVESNIQTQSKGTKIQVSNNSSGVSASSSAQSKQSGKNISYFDGNTTPTKPNLKWFAHDENIKGLITMRCSGNNSIKSKVLELNCSSAATMSKKIAETIDKIIKVKASASMESKAVKEHSSTLIFEVIF